MNGDERKSGTFLLSILVLNETLIAPVVPNEVEPIATPAGMLVAVTDEKLPEPPDALNSISHISQIYWNEVEPATAAASWLTRPSPLRLRRLPTMPASAAPS